MMKRRVRRLLLDATPAELRGEGTSDIARLVRDDPDVQAAAARILDELRAIDDGLAQMARLGAARIPLRDVAHPELPTARPAPRRHVNAGWRLALGLAGGAAALIAALLLWRQPLPSPAPVAAQSITATLDAESPRPFAVFATDNPDIAIVWLFDREES